MKKTILYLAMAMSLVACSDSNDALLESVSNEVTTSNSTEPSVMKKSWDGTWFISRAEFGNNNYHKYVDYYVGNNHYAIAHNISNSPECLGGFQEIRAHRPTSSNNYHYMDVRCYKPVSGPKCLPYPKIKFYTNKAVDNLRVGRARVSATTPPAHTGYGWPHGNSLPNFNDSQFNLAFDIYFYKPGQTQANYCAIMIWLTHEGNYGPAYDSNQLWTEATIDGVKYYVVGRTNWCSCQYQINYVRQNKSADVDNVNILAIINHAKANRFMGSNLSGASMTNINLGFEIFNAKGAEQNQHFSIDQYNLEFY